MTRKNTLAFEGREVRSLLEAERAHSGPVHIDWLRFTSRLRNAPAPCADVLFPRPLDKNASVWDPEYRAALVNHILMGIPDEDHSAAMQAHGLAERVAAILGPDFGLSEVMGKGHDFYKKRWSIVRNGQECGWVGFGASSDSPRQQAQAQTIHCNLYGTACTYGARGWREKVADLIDEYHADITRIDYALDFFDGIAGGMNRIQSDYMSGLCDNRGKRPKCNQVGDWCNGAERSFYIGSKEAGKQTNIYEKGHQLFGRDSGDNWQRVELRYGNKLRDLPSDALRRPADFFAGASHWHASMLREFNSSHVVVVPESITCRQRLQDKTADAAVNRVWRWLNNTAAPSVATAFELCGDHFLDLVTTTKIPKRLQQFSSTERQAAFDRLFPAQACPA